MTKELLNKFQPNIIFWIVTIISLLFGLGFIFMPQLTFEQIGFSIQEADGLFMVQYLGIYFVGLALFYFLVRNIELSKTRETIQIFFVFTHILSGIALVLYAVIGNTVLATNIFFWFTVSLHFIMPCFFIYFIIRDWKEVRAL